MSRRATKKEGEDPLYQKTVQQLKDELSQKGIRTSSTKKAELVSLLREAIDKSKPKKKKLDSDESEGKKSADSDEERGKKDDKKDDKKRNKDPETSKEKEKKSKTPEEKEPKTNEDRERKPSEEKESTTTQDETTPKSNKTDTTDGNHKSDLEKSRQTKLHEDEDTTETVKKYDSQKTTQSSTEDSKQTNPKNETKSKHTSGSMDTVISTDMLDDLISQESVKVTENPQNSKKRPLEDDVDKDDGMKEEKKEEEKIDDKELHVRKKKRSLETPALNPIEQHNANRVVPESTTPPTDTLHIKNFVRPFHNSSLKKMLEEHGNVTHFWINNIKSFCFVTYKTVEEAIKTRNAVHNLIWPPNNRGQPLVTEFITFEESKDQIENYGKDIDPAPGAIPKNVPPPQKPAKTLDELFRRTTVEPRIYYLPLTQEEVNNKLTSLGQPPLGSQPTQPQQPPLQQIRKNS